MAVYLLDRDIVIDIEKHAKDGTETPQLTYARSIDVDGNMVSPLLAVVEGMFGHRQTHEEMRSTLTKETALLADFYQHAVTDRRFLDEAAQDMAKAFVEQGRKDYQKYAPLIRTFLGRLGNTPPRREALKLMDWALMEARHHSVEVAHPITLAAIACIHGNLAARKILKPKAGPELVEEGDVYGAYSDLINISWLNVIRDGLGDVQFLTRDRNLEAFMQTMRLEVVGRHSDLAQQEETTQTNVSFDWGIMFPDLVSQPSGIEKAMRLFMHHHSAQRRGQPNESALQKQSVLLEHLIRRSGDLDAALWARLPDPYVPAMSLRRHQASLVATLMAVEHARASRLLIAEGMFTTGIGVARMQFEALARGMWLLYAATDEEVDVLTANLSVEAEKEANKLPMAAKMVDALDGRTPPGLHETMSAYKGAMLKELHSFVHAGIHPLQRHVKGYPEKLVEQVIRNTNGLFVATAAFLAVLAGSQPSMQAIRQLQESFADCLPELVSTGAQASSSEADSASEINE
jgi:hypothetical protein